MNYIFSSFFVDENSRQAVDVVAAVLVHPLLPTHSVSMCHYSIRRLSRSLSLFLVLSHARPSYNAYRLDVINVRDGECERRWNDVEWDVEVARMK